MKRKYKLPLAIEPAAEVMIGTNAREERLVMPMIMNPSKTLTRSILERMAQLSSK
jgi:hypothetical protein